jgi:hypothetical protein
MRLSVVHDVAGSIAAVAASPPESGTMGLALAPGQRATEIDMPELTAIADDAELAQRLAEIVETKRIEVEAPSVGRLVDKSERE